GRATPWAGATVASGCPCPAAAAWRSARRGVEGRTPKTGASVAHRGGPLALDRVGLVVARPGWHGHRDRGERRRAVVPELEVGPERDRERCARGDLDDRLRLAPAAPHPAPAREEIPQLLDRAVRHRARGLPGPQGGMP